MTGFARVTPTGLLRIGPSRLLHHAAFVSLQSGLACVHTQTAWLIMWCVFDRSMSFVPVTVDPSAPNAGVRLKYAKAHAEEADLLRCTLEAARALLQPQDR